jgi:predicted Zn-dependent peptidase
VATLGHAEKYFGAWKNNGAAREKVAATGQQPKTSSSTCHRPVRLQSPWVPAIKRNSPDYYAGLVTNAALALVVSRLNKEDRIKRGLRWARARDRCRAAGPSSLSANEERIRC